METSSVKDLPLSDSPFNITLNIEGRIFQTSQTTIQNIPGSLLGILNEDSKYFDPATKAFCFDRDSTLFPHILTAHRDGEIHVPQDVCAIQFKKEMDFWGIPETLIAPCCWSYFYKTSDDMETLRKIIQTLPKANQLTSNKTIDWVQTKDKLTLDSSMKHGTTKETTLKQKIWLFLDEPRSSKSAMVWCFTFVLVASLSVVLNVLWLEEGVRVDPYLTPFTHQGNATFNDKIRRLLLTDPHKVVLGLDCFCTAFFVAEMCIHFATCPNKRRYFCDWFYVAKAFLSLCMVYSTVFEFRKDWLSASGIAISWFLIKSMNTLRVTLIFKIYKINSTLNVLFLAFTHSVKELGLLLFVLFLMVIMFGGLIFAFEINSDMFSDTTKSMWWALITMTTIGYGDLHPTGILGYIVGVACAVVGIMMLALPIAVIASNFVRFKDRNDDIQKHLKGIRRQDTKTSERMEVEIDKDQF